MMAPVHGAEVGRWDPDLFAAFRKARGQRRRALKGEILRQNAPLIKILVAQVCNRADEKTAPTPMLRPRRSGKGKSSVGRLRVLGADEMSGVAWDDLYQVGLLGFGHALEKYDPARGKISGYARMWILTKIQRFVRRETLIPPPEGKESLAPGVTLYDDAEAIDRMAGGESSLLEAGIEGLTPAMIARWRRSGDWPEDLEELQARVAEEADGQARRKARSEGAAPAQPARRVISVPSRPIDAFLARLCIFGRRADRAPLWPLWNAWRAERGEASGLRIAFLEALATRGSRRITVRLRGDSPEDGLTAVRLVGA